MTASPDFSDPRAIAELGGLELRARTVVDGVLSGLHRGRSHGFSVEFADYREYTPGDDLRYLDWKAFGRSDRFYLKRYEAETGFVCQIVVDASESMRYRSEPAAVTKLEYARWLAAAIAMIVLRQRDAAGLTLFGDRIREQLEPSRRPTAITPLISTLEQTDAEGETAIGPVLHELAERFHPGEVIVILSDFFVEFDTLRSALRHLNHRRHDVRLLRIIDPAEADFPFDDLTLFRGLEGHAPTLADPRRFREAYREEFETACRQLDREAGSLGQIHRLARTDAPPAKSLREFLGLR